MNLCFINMLSSHVSDLVRTCVHIISSKIRYDILTKVNMGLFCVNKVSLLCEHGSILCENLLHKYLILTRSRPGMYIHVYT